MATVISRLGFKHVTVAAGDKYEWLFDVSCRSGAVQRKGSYIEVLDHCQLTPHEEIGPDLHNWVCKTDDGVTIWATLEQCIERGLLKKLSGEEE